LVVSALFVPSVAYAQTPPPAEPAPAPAAPAAPAPAPAAEPTPAPEPPKPAHSWFWRPPISFSVGEGDQKWTAQFQGFAELDSITDSTRGFTESLGQGGIPRNTSAPAAMTNAVTSNVPGQNGRTQFTARNSRLGLKLTAPTVDGIKPSALIEMDFFGNQPAATANATSNSPGGTISEGNFYTAATGRLRHAYVKLESDAINILAGQAYYVFGGPDTTFFPSTTEFFALPNMVFGRTPQLRLWETIKSDAVNVDIVAAAMRPIQRDSTIPEGQGAIVLKVNKFKGMGTPGAGGTGASPLAIGVSGTVRSFRVDPLVAAKGPGKDTGWGVSVDGFIPIIPADDSDDRGNKLTLTGTFTTGSGYGDLFGGLSGGFGGLNTATAPSLTPNAMTGNVTLPVPTPLSLQGDSDTGMVGYTSDGTLHTINWTTFKAGIQYYLPGGRFFITANVTHGKSDNLFSVATNGVGDNKGAARAIWNESLYWDASIFADITPNARVGFSYSQLQQTYGEDNNVTNSNNIAKNNRFRGCAYYFF
jgi:hypothetical protein